MAPQARSNVVIDDFPGLVTNQDGSTIPPGAGQVLTNFMCNRIGEITTRPGYVAVTFEDDAT